MKFMYGFTIMAALAAITIFALMGLAYIYEGKGLHPVLAGFYMLICALCAWILAGNLDRQEKNDARSWNA